MKQNGLFVKITASTLLLTFSYSQVLMAADVRQMLLDAKAFFDEQEAQRPHGMAASDLQAAQVQKVAEIEQQQMLQDFQNTSFNLTTPNGDVLKYVGDKLSQVERPDGTRLANIVTDAAGNIQNADLSLSDGSVQIFQSGQVVGYQTPDGSQVFYANGLVTKVVSKSGVETLYTYIKDAQGNVTETTLDNPQYVTKYDANKKIKEATRKSDNQKIYYTNGVIQKIVNADASQTLFSSSLVNGDTVVTPQGGASDVYIDSQGNKFYFTSGSVSKITLTDGSNLDSITWDASNKIDSANLTETDGSRYIYQLKKLTRSYDPAGVVTNFTYSTTAILAVKAGNTWEYLLDGTPAKYTNLIGDVMTYLTSGAYKGLKETEVLSTGVKYVYEYQGTGLSTSVQKREVVSTMYNITTFDGQTVNAQASNPAFRATVRFPSDGTIDQSVVITAVYSTTKNLKLNLVSGAGSTYTWNGVTTSLGVTLAKSTNYKVELQWEVGGIGIYIYAVTATKPTTATKSIADRAWDPKFKAVGTNVVMTLDGTSSGYYNQVSASREKSYATLGGSPATRMDFTGSAANYKTLYLKAVQWPSGSVSRTFDYWFSGTSWSFTQTEMNWSTGVKTVVNGSPLAQSYGSAKNYVAELRVESGKMNFYVYEKGLSRPATPASSFTAYTTVGASFETSSVSYMGTGAQYKNLTTPTVSSVTASPITARTWTIQNSSIVKPAAPGSVNATDFTSITYDATAALKQVLFKDGSKLVFDQGSLKQAFDTAGKLTSFNFEQSGLSNIVVSSIVQSNLTSTYAANGKLSSIKTGDLTIHYKTDGTTVEWIEKTDGTELWDLVFDASGNLTDAFIVAPDGEERKYTAGKLAGLRRPDNTLLFYAADKVTQMVTPEKITYNFDYTVPGIIQALLMGTPPVDTLTPIKMEYDSNFNLKKVVRQNQEILNYLNTDLMEIDAPSGAPKVFAYQKDAAGKVLSYTVTQGNVITYYDANNQPTRAVISPDAVNPNTLDISYQYGKIRQIKKNSVVTFNYTYSFTSDGTELTVVDDLGENTAKTYKVGDLISSLDKTTSVLSSYEYQNGKVSQVAVTRFGRALHTYAYSYSGTDTVVQDEVGVKRTYDANQKLTFLEKNGEKYAYTYTTQTVTTQNGPPVTTETLLPNTLYQTTARSLLSWNNGQAWFSYEQPYGKDYLQTHWAGQWVEYTVNVSQAGNLKIALEAADSNALPAGYATFQLELSVDGAVKGTMGVPAVGNNAWQAGTATLTGLSQGSHVVRLKFNNFVNDGVNQTDFKFRNIAFKQVVTTTSTTTQTVNIVQENLALKKIADGSTVYYTNGKVSQIDRTDGRIFKNILEDENGLLKEVRVFQNAQDTVGTKFNFTVGEMTKATLADGTVLDYSYEKDTAGAVTATWIRKGAANLKYNAQGVLTAMKLDGVMTPAEVAVATTHAYPSGYSGPSSIDGNFSTAEWNSIGCSGVGGCGATAISEHAFPQGQAVTGVTFQMGVSAYATGKYTREHNATYYVQVLRNGVWEAVAGTTFGCGGGDGSCSGNSGVVNLTGLNLANVTAIRAYANGFGNASGGEGSSGGSANIYELQYVLADQANLTFSTTTSGGVVAGYTFTGYKGQIKYDASGNVTLANANYTSVQQALTGQIQNLSKVPHKGSDFSLVYEALLDSETIVLQEYAQDGTLETQTKADGTVTLFSNNKPSQVLDSAGRTLIQYTYDAQGNPTRVYLKNARDTLPNEVLKAKESIEAQRAASLRSLAAQRNLAYQSIQTQYQDVQNGLKAQITQQETNYNNFSNTSAKGKLAKSAKADTLGQIAGNIDSLRAQLTGLYDAESDAYANLDAQVMTLSNQIETDASQAVTNLATQEANLKKEILRQEVSPIVYDYYRRILGRDPDTTEYNYWINLIDYNSGATLTEVKTTASTSLTAALSTYISALPELAQRQTYVNAIKTAVTSQINSYLAMTDAQKQAFAATLGLTAQDLIPFSSTDAQSILTWINSRSLHFGQSAFLALESLLDQKGKVYTRETLAKQAILVDILTGVISPLDDGDLVISVFALNKVAGLYGVTLTGANVSWDDLKAIVPATATATSPRVIAHINGNHYVIVTAMTVDSITYIDPGIGKDKQNESLTVTKAGFLKVWQGNVTLNQVDFNSIKTIRGAATQAKLLSVMEAKNVRGAFWGSLLNVLSFIVWVINPGLGLLISSLQIAGLVASIIEKDWLSAATSVVSLGFGEIGKAFGSFFNGAVQTLGPVGQALQAVGQVFGTVFNAVSGFVGNISNALGGFLKGIGIGSGIATRIAQTAVATGMSVATSKGLESLGVNPTIAGFAGALAGGFAIGASQADTTVMVAGHSYTPITQGQFIQQSISQVVTLANVGNLGMQLGLDATFTNILSLSLSAIQGAVIQNPTTDLQKSFSIVKPIIKDSLTWYGLTKAGESLGLNSNIAMAAAMPISQTLSAALNGGSITGQNIVQSIQSSLVQGAVAYGIKFVGETSPILGSLLSQDIALGIEQALGLNGLFGKIFKVLDQAALNIVNVVGGAVQTLFGGVTNLNDSIQQNGLVPTLEAAKKELFSRSSQEAILAKGGLQNALNTIPKVTITLANGATVKEVKFSETSSLYFDSTGNNIVGKKEDGVTQYGTFGRDLFGKTALRNGEVFGKIFDTQSNGYSISASIENGQAMSVRVIEQMQNTEIINIGEAEFLPQNTPIYFEAPKDNQVAPSLWTSLVNIAPLAMSFTFKQGVAEAADFTVNSPVQASVAAASKLSYVLCNGIANPKPNPDVPPDYIMNLTSDLVSRSANAITSNDIITVPLYQPTVTVPIFNFTDYINQGIDAVKWAIESQQSDTRTQLTNKVIQDLNTYFWDAQDYAQLVRPMIAMGYSGGFMPLVEAIANQRYNVTTLVALGAATVDLGKDLAAVAVKIFGAIEQYIVAKAQARANDVATLIQELNGYLFSIKPIQDVVNQVINAIQTNIDQGISLLADILSESNPRKNLVSLTNTNVKQILNVWGTEDVLYKLGLGGKRVNLCDKNTINVQIEGATHFDYMYRTSWNNEAERVWNRHVSNFVTDLMRASESGAEIDQFLSDHLIFRDANGVYEVSKTIIDTFVGENV